MKRNMDLLRSILLEAEKADDVVSGSEIATSVGADERLVFYHMLLLREAGLIDAIIHCPSGDPYPDLATLKRLTYAGHEFIDAVRGDAFWSRVKEHTKSKGVELTFDSVKATVKLLIQQLLG